MDFQEFNEDIVDLGAQAFDKGNGHWQVKIGPATINFYPNSQNQTIFVNPVKGLTEPKKIHAGTISHVKKLVKELQDKLTKEKSNDTSTTSTQSFTT